MNPPVTSAGMEAHLNIAYKNTAIKRTKITIIVGIHKGAVTHHHDQVIFPNNFKIRNTINVAPQIPIPPDELLDTLFAIISPHKKTARCFGELLWNEKSL